MPSELAVGCVLAIRASVVHVDEVVMRSDCEFASISVVPHDLYPLPWIDELLSDLVKVDFCTIFQVVEVFGNLANTHCSIVVTNRQVVVKHEVG